MKIKVLPGIRESSEVYEQIEKEIEALFRSEIYIPLMKEIGFGKEILKNDISYGLINAIMRGRVTFYNGKFRGKFDSHSTKDLKKLGAEYDRTSGSWKLRESKLPLEVRHAISLSANQFQEKLRKIDKILKEFLPEKISEKFSAEKIFDTALWKMEHTISKSLDGITVVQKLSSEQRAQIAKEYTTDLKRYIKGWSEKEIGRLRVKVVSETLEGNRWEKLVQTIQSSYGVSSSKAKFLARQETHLMMASFKKSRYQSSGIDEYIWTTVVGSPNHPVRPMHKELNGKVFRFDNPPITSEDGRRNNPGEDFNCRCMARPVVRFD